MENNMILDDGLPIRVFGRWTSVKLDYLRRYITMFATSMRGKPWRSRNYIDLYCGSGKYRENRVGEVFLGSPLIALTTAYPFTHYHFSDTNKENLKSLELRTKQYSNDIEYWHGNANQIVNQVVDKIQKIDDQILPGAWSSLNLAFLDPDGLELEWSTIQRLASLYTMDLIIHYSQYGLNLNLKHCYESPNETDIDRFFGTCEWRKMYKCSLLHPSTSKLHRELIELYKGRLVELKYEDIHSMDSESEYEPTMRNTKNVPLYKLIFASKHKKGLEFWSKVTARDIYGNTRLL